MLSEVNNVGRIKRIGDQSWEGKAVKC